VTDPMRVLAVDLGAGSVRVAAIDLGAAPAVEVLHRRPHSPVVDPGGALRWDWERIVAEVETGLEIGIESDSVESIGIDGWGVDYGLIDDAGRVIADPYSYRDSRTDGWMATAESIGLEHLYQITGIQLMGINTIFQLAAHDRTEMEQAARVLLLPDLLVSMLTGFEGAERSNASTTGLLDARSGQWSAELIEAIGMSPQMLPGVAAAGQAAGKWRGIPVHLVGSHDTASAFVGVPGGREPGTVFVSTGSWVIVGIERTDADTSPAAMAANFSNESGALGGFRFLKNVVGFWMVEACRPIWGDPPIDVLIDEATAVTAPVPRFDAADKRLVAPDDMEAEIRAAAGLPAGVPRGVVVRSILESIAHGVARVVGELEVITATEMTRLALVGGGARTGLLADLLAESTGLPVLVGNPEATALGNGVVQGIALGHFDGRDGADQWLAAEV
jgi:rhamnulokinase